MGNYIQPSDIDNWPAGTSTAQKNEIIERIELQLEELTERHFYAQAFDIELNGNGKNQLFLPLETDIITVSKVEVCGIELDSTWYAFDNDSIYLDLCGSGGDISGPELSYRLKQYEGTGIFPEGINNIRIEGSYGDTRLLNLAKEACKIMIKAENNPSLYPRFMKSEKIGDYSYDNPGVGAMTPDSARTYTGIREADQIIDILVRDKPQVMTP